MQIERDLNIGIGSLTLIFVLVSFGTVGLLVRMSPAIEQILRENVVSLGATQEMTAALALRGSTVSEAQQATRFRTALRQARANITEPEERETIERIAAYEPGALRGEPVDRAATVEALVHLQEINRSAMHRADEQAKRLVIAGAWATVVMVGLALLISWAVLRRLRRRLISPLVELSETLDAVVLDSDPHRRCRTIQAPAELTRIMQRINTLLDRLAAEHEARRTPPPEAEPETAEPQPAPTV